MTEYHAKSSKLLNFELTQDEKPVGKLSYKSWFKFDALIEIIGDRNYQVEPKGFWGTTIEVKDNEKVLLKFKMNWKGEIVLQAYPDGVERGFTFKHKGFLKESFVLADQEGTELLVMKPRVKWSKMAYEYSITTTENFEAYPGKELLLMSSLHCANYYMTIVAAAA